MKKSTGVNRPWGNFEQFVLNDKCTVKMLTVNPGQSLSKQDHEKREEWWIFLDDGLGAEIGDKSFSLWKGEQITIPKKTKHKLFSNSKSAGRVLEISFGEFDENDIKRYEDRYGRAA